VRFETANEHILFAESVRGALSGWEAPREPEFGTWQDDRDDALAERLRAVGWEALWADPALLAPAVAGGIELGRSVAPLSLVDDATLGGPLVLEGRARHGAGGEPEVTLDGSGTVRGVSGRFTDDPARRRAWTSATLAYMAGLADGALGLAIEHARTREQFGAPLASLPTVQARLADAALARDGLILAAWSSANPGGPFPATTLAWGGSACREVTAHVQQMYGAIGFALEGGSHRFYLRAKTIQVWTDAALREVAG
jgi:hypothetical protein